MSFHFSSRAGFNQGPYAATSLPYFQRAGKQMKRQAGCNRNGLIIGAGTRYSFLGGAAVSGAAAWDGATDKRSNSGRSERIFRVMDMPYSS